MASKSHAFPEAEHDNNTAIYTHLELLMKFNLNAPELKYAAIKLRIDTDAIPAMFPYGKSKKVPDITQGIKDVISNRNHGTENADIKNPGRVNLSVIIC